MLFFGQPPDLRYDLGMKRSIMSRAVQGVALQAGSRRLVAKEAVARHWPGPLFDLDAGAWAQAIGQGWIGPSVSTEGGLWALEIATELGWLGPVIDVHGGLWGSEVEDESEGPAMDLDGGLWGSEVVTEAYWDGPEIGLTPGVWEAEMDGLGYPGPALEVRGGTWVPGLGVDWIGPETSATSGSWSSVTVSGDSPNIVSPDGYVRAILPLEDGGAIVGGQFDRWFTSAMTTGSGAYITVPGNVLTPFRTNGTVFACIPDGTGGVIVGGQFTAVNGYNREGLARIDSDGTLNSWNPGINQAGSVFTLLVSGSTVYVGGSFFSLGGSSRSNIGAVSLSSGVVTSWNPGASAPVYAIHISAVYSGYIVVGGMFSVFGGSSRSRIGETQLNVNSATSWNPGAGGTVYVIRSTTSNIYVGGNFTSFGGSTRNRLANNNQNINTPGTWNPAPNNEVYDMLIQSSTVYVAGSFSSIGGLSRTGLASVSTTATTAANSGFNANVSGVQSSVTCIAIDGTRLVAAGRFSNLGAHYCLFMGSVNTTTGAADIWSPFPSGDPQCLCVQSAGRVAVGGQIMGFGHEVRNHIARINADGTLNAWSANANGSVHALARYGDEVIVGGDFTSIGGQPRNRIAAININTGVVSSWNPGANGLVRTLLIVADWGNVVWVGGDFTTIGGLGTAGLTYLSLTSSAGIGWGPQPNGSVRTLAREGHHLLIGGDFTTIFGLSRSRVAAMNISLGVESSWNPGANTTVNTIATYRNKIYLGGLFTMVGGQAQFYMARLNIDSNVPETWSVQAASPANCFVVADPLLLIGRGGLAPGSTAVFRVYNLATGSYVAEPRVGGYFQVSDGVMAIGVMGPRTPVWVGGSFSGPAAVGPLGVPSNGPLTSAQTHRYGLAKLIRLDDQG